MSVNSNKKVNIKNKRFKITEINTVPTSSFCEGIKITTKL